MSTASDELVFYHFNDVYHVDQPKLLSRFAHVFREAKDNVADERKPITVFSGDGFSPSLESSVMKGDHILPVLNHLMIDVACYGNHDFDFGEKILTGLSERCTFPWLLANAVHSDGRLLSAAKEYLVLERKGYKIGFFGLAGTDWPSNCQRLPVGSQILDPVPIAAALARRLKTELGADIVVALTHMRHEDDARLADMCGDLIDLILGGHDHDLAIRGSTVNMVNNTFEGDIKVVKSGTDFKNYSIVRMAVTRNHEGRAEVQNMKVYQMPDLSLEKRHPEDPAMSEILSGVKAKIATVVDKPLCYTAVPLECRSVVIRTAETNLGNLLADAVRAYYDTDVALINSGSMRCDRIMDPGVLTAKDVLDVVPFDNAFVVKRLTGATLLAALENSVSDIVDGRFFQISGLCIEVDRARPVGSRVLSASLVPGHTSANAAHSDVTSTLTGASTDAPGNVDSAGVKPLERNAEYTVAMIAFIAEGFDGYELFRGAPTLVGEESAMTDASLLMQVFRGNDHASAPSPSEGRQESDSDREDEVDRAVDRARAAVVVGRTDEGLPIVKPEVQSRILMRSTLSKY